MCVAQTEPALIDQTQQPQSIEDLLTQVAQLPPKEFTVYFCRMRQMFQEEVTHACVRYIADHGLQGAGEQMRNWLCTLPGYLGLLFDPSLLPLESAQRLIVLFRDTDPQFFRNFFHLTNTIEQPLDPKRLSRALVLIESFEQHDVLIPWLRNLTNHQDDRVRSKAIKMLCTTRPNKSMIERHMLSVDPRIRANALEAAWGVKTREAELIFLNALSDSNHRVVANALVGLYGIDSAAAFEHIALFAKNPSHMFRRAMVWALAHLHDQRAIPVLSELKKDSDPVVRSKASRALATFPVTEKTTSEPSEHLPPTVIAVESLPVEPERGMRAPTFKLL